MSSVVVSFVYHTCSYWDKNLTLLFFYPFTPSPLYTTNVTGLDIIPHPYFHANTFKLNSRSQHRQIPDNSYEVGDLA